MICTCEDDLDFAEQSNLLRWN